MSHVNDDVSSKRSLSTKLDGLALLSAPLLLRPQKHHVSTPSIADPRRALAILQGYHLTPKLHATIRVTVFLLDSLFQAGYGYEREQARGGLLDEAMQIPIQAEG